MLVFEFFAVLHWNKKYKNILVSVVFIVLAYFIDFSDVHFPTFEHFWNKDVFYSQWHLKIIVHFIIIVLAVYMYVNFMVNPAGMTGQLHPIDISVNKPFKDHLWKRLPLLGCLLKPVSYICSCYLLVGPGKVWHWGLDNVCQLLG